MPPADDFGLVGQTIDQLRFEAVVDGGGFGVVYRAIHEGLDEPVAVKCLRLHQSLDASLSESFFQRFKDETRILYRLSQGSLDIVRGISSGTLTSPRTGEGVPYMVLEWLDGHPLTKELRARILARKPYTLEEAMALLDPVFSALAHAHAQGIVHRDIKPGNLFFARARDGSMRLKVLDFGLAKIFEPTLGVVASVQTMGGVALCSPSYGAPEQFLRRFGPIGPWTDVYALALLLLELLAAKKVRHAEGLAEALHKAIEKETASPTAASLGLSLPPEVAAVLERAVDRETSVRPADAGKLRDELRAAMTSAAAPKPSTPPKAEDVNVTVALPDRAFALARAAAFGAPAPGPAGAGPAAGALQQTALLPGGAFGRPDHLGATRAGLSDRPPPPQQATLPVPTTRAAPLPAAGRPPSVPPGPAAPPPRSYSPPPRAAAPRASTPPPSLHPPPPEPPASADARARAAGGILASTPDTRPEPTPRVPAPPATRPGRARTLAIGVLVVLAAFAIVASYIYFDQKRKRGAELPHVSVPDAGLSS